MKYLNLALLSGLLASGGTSVLAADLIIDEAPLDVAIAHDWSGGYVGVHLGYTGGKGEPGESEGSVGDLFVALAADDGSAIDAAGFLIGLQAGANWQMGSIVVGLEGQVGYLGASGGDDPVVDFGAYADLTGRLGVAVDTVLFYLKGGVAVAQLEMTDAMGTELFSGTRAGWTVGTGVELALDQNWSAKAEYQYYDFGTKDAAEADFSAHTFKVGLNYAF